MTPDCFINRFYSDEEYKNTLIKKVAIKKSNYSPSELSEHYNDMSKLYNNMLLDKISSEIYSYTKEIKLGNLL